MQRVEVRGVVELAGVPEVGAVGEGCVKGFEALGLRGWGGGFQVSPATLVFCWWRW